MLSSGFDVGAGGSGPGLAMESSDLLLQKLHRSSQLIQSPDPVRVNICMWLEAILSY